MNTIILKSESGLFFLDENGFVFKFEPDNTNPITEELTSTNTHYHYQTSKSIRTLIVPEGVNGFCNSFRNIKVLERFELPEGLLYLGNQKLGVNCVFANCVLPEVKIPSTVLEVGDFAFGHSDIGTLWLPPTLKSKYMRQFKDSHIGTLYLPRTWECYCKMEHDHYSFNIPSDLINEYGFLLWYSTKVDEVIYY